MEQVDPDREHMKGNTMMRTRHLKLAGPLLVIVAMAALPRALAAQTPTRLLVRAVANDAKVIGSGVGGARITVRNARTGEVLANGEQKGSTGDTNSIMVAPRMRGSTVFGTEGAAHFIATLALEEPTLVEVVAEGPLGTEQALRQASKTILMIPGEDFLGEGLILNLYGFTVVIEEPAGDGARKAGSPFEVKAEVTMLCGCPTEPGGMWDSDQISITARLLRGDAVVADATLRYAGERSTYVGSLTVSEAGHYDLLVLAVDAGRANSGMARSRVEVR